MKHFSNPQVLAYGALSLPLAFAALPLYVHLPKFYAESAGLSLALLGGILLAMRLLDAVLDPWLGAWADQYPRRRLILLAFIPLLVGFVALFHPPSQYQVLWLITSLGFTHLGYSMAVIAYQAWGSGLGSVPNETHPSSTLRTRLTASREGLGLIGIMLASTLPTILDRSLVEGLKHLSWIFVVLSVVCLILTLGTQKNDRLPSAPSRSLGHNINVLWRERALLRLFAVFMINGVASAIPATLFLFYVADVIGAESASGYLLLGYFACGAMSIPLWVKCADRFGRVPTWGLSMLLAIITFAGAGFLGEGDVWPYALICLLSGLALGADLILPSAMAADWGERLGQSGMVFGVWNFIAKLNLALSGGLALTLLHFFGYRPATADMATQGVGTLILVYAVLPLILKTVAGMVLWRYRHQVESVG